MFDTRKRRTRWNQFLSFTPRRSSWTSSRISPAPPFFSWEKRRRVEYTELDDDVSSSGKDNKDPDRKNDHKYMDLLVSAVLAPQKSREWSSRSPKGKESTKKYSKERRAQPKWRSTSPWIQTNTMMFHWPSNYKVHEVRTPEEQCSIQTFTFATKSFCFVTAANGEEQYICIQLDFCSGCAAIIVPRGSDRRFQQHTSWTPKRSWRSNQRRAGSLYGHLCKRSKSQEEIPCTEGSVSPASTRIVQAVCLREKHRVEILDWQWGFWLRWFEEVLNPKSYVTGRVGTYIPSRPTNKATSSGRRLDEYCEVSKTNSRITDRPIPLRPQDEDFGWVATWQQANVGIFSTSISNQLSFKDKYVMWIVMWYMSIATRSRSPTTHLQDWKKPAYVMNEAHRRWWNIFDNALSHGSHTSRSMLLRIELFAVAWASLGRLDTRSNRWHNRTAQKSPTLSHSSNQRNAS